MEDPCQTLTITATDRERERITCSNQSSRRRVSMEDTCETLTITANNNHHLRRGRRLNGDEANGFDCDDEEEDDGEECDKEVWNVLSKSFRQVQSMLDRNRLLIHRVNENHQSKIPENLVKNVALIREINGNISEIVSLYSDLSFNFSNVVGQRRAILVSKIDEHHHHHNMEKSKISKVHSTGP